MNAAGYVIWAFVFAAGLFMTISWFLRNRRRAPQATASEKGLRVLGICACVAGLVIVSIVAKPGPQPGWTNIVGLTIILPFIVGVQNVRALNSAKQQSRRR